MMDAKTLNQLVFLNTPTSPCSYLPERESRSIFLHPEQTIDTDLYTQLNLLGFRRSGAHLYRPWCDHCQACQAVRVDVAGFKASKNQRRVFNRNQDLTVAWCAAEKTPEYYALYEKYINNRHADGDMYPPSEQQFDGFLCRPPDKVNSYFLCFKKNQRLIGVAVVDLLPEAISAIYTFYDPAEEVRSLGKLSILWIINWAQKQSMPYVYLGYWVRDCQKMSYKVNYQPLERFTGLEWRPMEKDLSE